VPEALRAAGAQCHAHDDLFDRNTSDVEWLARAGRERWVVLTRDQRIRYHQVERDALVSAGVQCFTVTSAKLTGPEAAELLVSAIGSMKRLIARHQGRPFIAKVSRGPDVEILELY
jgi:hypothetical protein